MNIKNEIQLEKYNNESLKDTNDIRRRLSI